jgi:hypothetical protein
VTDSIATLLVIMFFVALAMTGISWLMWIAAAGRAASWTLLEASAPILLWVTGAAATLALAFVWDVCNWVRRRIVQRRAIRAELEQRS